MSHLFAQTTHLENFACEICMRTMQYSRKPWFSILQNRLLYEYRIYLTIPYFAFTNNHVKALKSVRSQWGWRGTRWFYCTASLRTTFPSPHSIPIKATGQDHFFLSSSKVNQRCFTDNDFRSNCFSPRPFLHRPTLNKVFQVGQPGPKALQWSVKPGEGITPLLGKYHGNMAQSSQLKTCISWERPQLSRNGAKPLSAKSSSRDKSRTQVQIGPEFLNSAINVLWSVSNWHIDTISQSPSVISNEKFAFTETDGVQETII